MRLVVGVLACVIGAAGCDWRKFDDLEKKTPVAAIGAPSNYSAGDDFGPILLALPPPADGSAAGRFLATAVHQLSVAVVSFDAAGRPSGAGVSQPAFDILGQGWIRSIAAIPGGQEVLLAAPTEDVGDVFVMKLEPPYEARTFIATQVEEHYGIGLGAGNVTGGAAPDVVVLSASTLHLYIDGLPAMDKTYVSMGAFDPCPLEFPSQLPDDDKVNRTVIVAPLLASGTQIAVGVPAASGVGHVSVFSYDATAGVLTCAAALTGAETHFGRAMTLVDVEGNGTRRLLVGAPPTRAYLYSLPLSTGATPTAMATDMMTGGDFGAAVAAFDIDGKPGDEMFIGNPQGTVGSTTTAGRVSVYTGAAMTLLPSPFPNPLAQNEPGAGKGYGLGVAGMTFCPGSTGGAADGGAPAGDGGTASCTTLPIVGSRAKVFAYFTLKKPDPRVK